MPDPAAYGIVFLVFPIWGETSPPVIRSFLKRHDLAGHTPGVQIEPAFSMEADQERRTLHQVTGWLNETGLR